VERKRRRRIFDESQKTPPLPDNKKRKYFAKLSPSSRELKLQFGLSLALFSFYPATRPPDPTTRPPDPTTRPDHPQE